MDPSSGWEAQADEASGGTYYYNHNTQETSWDVPGNYQAPVWKEGQEYAWLEETDEAAHGEWGGGQQYYSEEFASEGATNGATHEEWVDGQQHYSEEYASEGAANGATHEEWDDGQQEHHSEEFASEGAANGAAHEEWGDGQHYDGYAAGEEYRVEEEQPYEGHLEDGGNAGPMEGGEWDGEDRIGAGPQFSDAGSSMGQSQVALGAVPTHQQHKNEIWHSEYDEGGFEYFVNSETGETTYDKPVEMLDAEMGVPYFPLAVEEGGGKEVLAIEAVAAVEEGEEAAWDVVPKDGKWLVRQRWRRAFLFVCRERYDTILAAHAAAEKRAKKKGKSKHHDAPLSPSVAAPSTIAPRGAAQAAVHAEGSSSSSSLLPTPAVTDAVTDGDSAPPAAAVSTALSRLGALHLEEGEYGPACERLDAACAREDRWTDSRLFRLAGQAHIRRFDEDGKVTLRRTPALLPQTLTESRGAPQSRAAARLTPPHPASSALLVSTGT